MLTKNVYILYPAGYGGSYASWSINISDTDRCVDAVPDPVNAQHSNKYGGIGTAHMQVRIPTHQSLTQHLSWVLYNRPTDYRIYLINVGDNSWVSDSMRAITEIAQYDPTGVFINIHESNDDAVAAYGEINCVTKWPTFAAATVQIPEEAKPFDPFNCSNDINLRNFAATNKTFFFRNRPVNRAALRKNLDRVCRWYKTRNRLQPHEVNDSTYYIKSYDEYDLDSRIYEFSCADVASDRWPDIIGDILERSGISSSYSLEYLKGFHHNYVAAQSNLLWFQSYDMWCKHGALDSYIMSHSIVQAQILKQILKHCGIQEVSNTDALQWQVMYHSLKGNDWPSSTTNEYDFWTLPQTIRSEILRSGYKLKLKQPLVELLNIDWANTDLPEINRIYQQNKHKLGG